MLRTVSELPEVVSAVLWPKFMAEIISAKAVGNLFWPFPTKLPFLAKNKAENSSALQAI